MTPDRNHIRAACKDSYPNRSLGRPARRWISSAAVPGIAPPASRSSPTGFRGHADTTPHRDNAVGVGRETALLPLRAGHSSYSPRAETRTCRTATAPTACWWRFRRRNLAIATRRAIVFCPAASRRPSFPGCRYRCHRGQIAMLRTTLKFPPPARPRHPGRTKSCRRLKASFACRRIAIVFVDCAVEKE